MSTLTPISKEAPASSVSGLVPDPCPDLVEQLLERARAYLPSDQTDLIYQAYRLGALAHDGQTRKSGEAYITHPVSVALLLVDLGMDVETLCAAILHDVLEDTPIERERIASQFGETVAELVDGVTKLDKLHFGSRQEANAESFRKMLLAMARDLRVILIKLADRLHNMRTIDAMSDDSRRRIARETLEIYARIAQRLGMNRIKGELQDLGFKVLHPKRHAVITRHVQTLPVARREAMGKIEEALAQSLTREGIAHRLVWRVKSPYSIYRKMKQEQKTFDQVMDVFGFRVIVGSVMQCYMALGAVHALFKPVDKRFRDFIAIPKANGYQSLHTLLFSSFGSPIEVQIRTEEMDQVAERGIAAHWLYKTPGSAPSSVQSRAQSWLTGLVESQKEAGSSQEFLDNVKIDLFPDEVYLFSPKGDILSLPRNATALDYAYAVHTKVGDHAVAARVDKKLAPLRTRLNSGQTVEIITAPSATPSPSWLDWVVSSRARTSIRHFLKHLQHEDAVELGHRMLDGALESLDSSLDRIPASVLDQYLADARLRRLEDLLAEVALGNRMALQVAQALARTVDGRVLEPHVGSAEKILITGAERGVLNFPDCCLPVPGDDIVGYLSSGKGIVVHRTDCKNVPELRKNAERMVPIGWDRQVSGEFRSSIRIEVENKPGVLAQVAAAIAETKANIDNVEYQERDLASAVIVFLLNVRDRKHIADVIRRVRRLPVAVGVQRR